MEELQQFFNQLPIDLQEKIKSLPPEKQQEVLMNLMQRKFEFGGDTNRIPIEAEKNENVTVNADSLPVSSNGVLEKKSMNPVTNQVTYEIPENGINKSHSEGGVDILLAENSVVNSDKTKIPIDFKIYNKNFKNKTFKEASDYISKKENEVQDNYIKAIEEKKTDKVSEGTLNLILAKLGKERNELNNLQEYVLQNKKAKEKANLINSNLKEYGGLIKQLKKAEDGYNGTMDLYLNYKVNEDNILKAEDGFNTSLNNFKNFAESVNRKGITMPEIIQAFKKSNLGKSYMPNKSSKSNEINFNPSKVKIPKEEVFTSIMNTSQKYKLDPALMLTMAHIESTFNPNATSKTGAAGVYQFTKGTGRDYGIPGDKRYDLNSNVDAAARLMLDNQKILIKNQVPITPEYMYLAHQLGAGGAVQIYNNITKGTPIPESTKKNMGHNWGAQSGQAYLDLTSKKLMPKYLGYESELNKKDSEFNLKSMELKQKYQLPNSPEEIKNSIYSNGFQNSVEKFKSGEYLKNNFEYGGKILANEGLKLVGTNIKNYTSEKEKGNEEYWRALYSYYAGEDSPLKNKFSYNPNEPLTKQKQLDFQDFLFTNLGADFIRQYLMTQEPSAEAKRQGVLKSSQFDEKSDNEIKAIFMDGLRGWRAPIVKSINELSLPSNGQTITSNGVTYTTYKDQALEKYNTPTGQIYYYNPGNEKVKYNSQEEIDKYIASLGEVQPQTLNEEKYYFDKNQNKFIHPYLETSQKVNTEAPTETPAPAPTPTPTPEVKEVTDLEFKDSDPKKATFLDKVNYGLENLLYPARLISLMREKQFNPVLQQKPYDNPYDNMRTDVDIQSNLNDNQRMLLSQIQDSRGNPSVRNARLAQLMANTTNANNQLYSQKYNQELNLENQQTTGQSQYRGQLDDINRQLKKQFEHEVLQTREVARQQKNMALDDLFNYYNSQKEQKQALDLSLLETDYTFNPITQKFEVDKEKRRSNYAKLKFMYNNSKNQTRQMSEDYYIDEYGIPRKKEK